MKNTQQNFYSRPMVRRLIKIFDNPTKPTAVAQKQFDNCDDDLFVTSQKEWHEIDESDYWHYLLDLCYVSLQQNLFDYVFPAFLIKWWEGQLSRFGGPDAECGFYRAVDHGKVFDTMMTGDRRTMVYDWMVDAYMDGIAEWSGHLLVTGDGKGPNNFTGPLWSFWAVGLSVPILDAILARLETVSNQGVAQWWLVFASGVAYNEDGFPHISGWEQIEGGGVCILDSLAGIYDHGLLDGNWLSFKNRMSAEFLIDRVRASLELLGGSKYEAWANDVLSTLIADPDRTRRRIELLTELLKAPDFGDELF
jgi:hypothetical protein